MLVTRQKRATNWRHAHLGNQLTIGADQPTQNQQSSQPSQKLFWQKVFEFKMNPDQIFLQASLLRQLSLDLWWSGVVGFFSRYLICAQLEHVHGLSGNIDKLVCVHQRFSTNFETQ